MPVIFHETANFVSEKVDSDTNLQYLVRVFCPVSPKRFQRVLDYLLFRANQNFSSSIRYLTIFSIVQIQTDKYDQLKHKNSYIPKVRPNNIALRLKKQKNNWLSAISHFSGKKNQLS